LNEEQWKCVFCEKGKDSLEHYVRDCDKIKAWFRELGCEDGEIFRTFLGRG